MGNEMRGRRVKAARNDKNSKSGNYVLLNSYGMRAPN